MNSVSGNLLALQTKFKACSLCTVTVSHRSPHTDEVVKGNRLLLYPSKHGHLTERKCVWRPIILFVYIFVETVFFLLLLCPETIFYFSHLLTCEAWGVLKMGNIYSCLVILCSDYPWINGTLPIKSKICNLSSFSSCYIEADSQLLKNIIVTVCLFSSVHANC